jgi:hypothetical protein
MVSVWFFFIKKLNAGDFRVVGERLRKSTSQFKWRNREMDLVLIGKVREKVGNR